jgi:SAM-dependent methyltransferase
MSREKDSIGCDVGSSGNMQTPRFGIEDALQKIAKEMMRRKGPEGVVNATYLQSVSLPQWRPSRPRLHAMQEYKLNDFLGYFDQDFIDQVYFALLKRSPDKHSNAFLVAMRDGELSKVEVIGDIRFSQEGVQRGVHVDGLLIPYKLRKWCRKKWVGRLLSWALSFFRLDSLKDSYERTSQLQAVEISNIGQLHNNTIKSIETRFASIAAKVGETATAQQMEDVQQAFCKLKSDIGNIVGELGTLQTQIRRHAAHLDLVDVPLQNSDYDKLYSDFENYFRGSRDLVRERCVPYLQLVKSFSTGANPAPIVDIGCGRGEWLELLRDHEFIAKGFDLNSVFIEQCKSFGLNVELEDGVVGLSKIDRDSLGAVTSMHLVEHLSTEKMIALIDQANRTLRSGGLLLLETPNPENVRVASCGFYTDLTHRNPIPPDALKWLVHARGFRDVRIERLTHARDNTWPPQVDAGLPGAHTINAMNVAFSAAPDYAVIAYKP